MQGLSFVAIRSVGSLSLLALLCPLCFSQRSLPVALVTEAKDARIRRANLQTPVPAYKGDLIFADDTLLAARGNLTISFCPKRLSYSFVREEIKVERARVLPEPQATRQLPFCQLPAISLQTQRDLRSSADRLQTTAVGNVAQADTDARLTPEQQAKLEPLDAALRASPQDITTKLALAIALEEAGNFNGAVREYQALAKLAPNAAWIADEVRDVIAQRERLALGEGNIIAVVVGIAHYNSLPDETQLQFADKDAENFYDYLISRRGGARSANVSLLLNENAKLGNVRVAIGYAFAQAKPTDTVIIFIAGHGIAQDKGPNAGAYILTHESSPETLPVTAMRMEELQELTSGNRRPHQVQLFVDVCHSGLIGTIQNHKFNIFMTEFLDQDRPSTQVLGLLASREKELSYECANFEHGAFTYFLLRGLNTTTKDAIDKRSNRITVNSLTHYVQEHVRGATDEQQNPEKRGNIADRIELANKDAEGLEPQTLHSTKQTVSSESCESSRGRRARNSSNTQNAAPSDPYSNALQRGLILPGIPGSAFDMLAELRGTLSPDNYIASRNRLLATLENAGQEVILQYLRGEAVQMRREDFARGEAFFAAASALLSGGDSFVESRRLFCRGRQLIFEHRLTEAISTLEEAIRLDTLGAYSYNALGIAFLENPDYKKAIAAFQDAIRMAPSWAYARHNLALALTQDGQYTPAIAAYRAAMLLGPEYSYIPYNLGLLYQRLNRPQEARGAWQQSLAVAPRMARAWNAIGLSYFLERHLDKAEDAYRRALALADNQVDLLAIRHDFALLLNDRQQLDEAVRLWRLNLAEKPDDLPSLIGLSDAFTSRGQTQAALDALSALLLKKQDYAGARLQYAKMLVKAGRPEDATTQLNLVLASNPGSSEVYELLADLRSPLRKATVNANTSEALKLYEIALKNAVSGEQRSRIRRKIRLLKR